MSRRSFAGRNRKRFGEVMLIDLQTDHKLCVLKTGALVITTSFAGFASFICFENRAVLKTNLRNLWSVEYNKVLMKIVELSTLVCQKTFC